LKKKERFGEFKTDNSTRSGRKKNKTRREENKFCYLRADADRR
jgi:hypothetical protein